MKRDRLLKELGTQGVPKAPKLENDRQQFSLQMRKQEFETNRPSQETLFQLKNEEIVQNQIAEKLKNDQSISELKRKQQDHQ